MKKMKTITFVLTSVIFFCYRLSYSSDDFEKIYRIVMTKPQVQLSLLNGNIQVVNIYKDQIKSIYESRNMNEEDRISQFVHDVYFPHREYWGNFYDEDGFKKWTKSNWDNLTNIKTPGIMIPFEVDFDSLFSLTVSKLKILTSKEPQGKWYLVYGNKASGIGGFSNGSMFVDFFGVGNKGAAGLIFNLPHEINHQIFSKTNAGAYSLLYRIIDEGFACYVNYIYWDKKFSPARNIDFTEQEWKWCMENENIIFKYAKPFLDSTNSVIINKFSRAHSYIFKGAPGRIAYFIGFRICEAYVKKNGADAWKDIYNTQLVDVLRLSDYENNIHN